MAKTKPTRYDAWNISTHQKVADNVAERDLRKVPGFHRDGSLSNLVVLPAGSPEPKWAK